MAKRAARRFSLFLVSVDFDTTRRARPPYYLLKTTLQGLGGVLKPTYQITLLLSPLTASKIRDKIRSSLLNSGDRVYVGKIAAGSAWYNLLNVSNKELKAILRTWAGGATPSASDIKAAAHAVKGLLPRRKR